MTVSNIGCKPADVNVYNSLPTGYLATKQHKQQIAGICSLMSLILQSALKMSRRGHNDCGVLALAIATSLCAGDDPAYVQHLLQGHLPCLTNSELTTFPRRNRKKTNMSPRWLVSYNAYCTCHLPKRKNGTV